MAFVKRMEVENAPYVNYFGGEFNVEIFQDGYSGRVETFKFGNPAILIEMEGDEDSPFWKLGPSTFRIRIRDDQEEGNRYADLLNQPDKRVRIDISFFGLVWSGYLRRNRSNTLLYEQSIVELVAEGTLNWLASETYDNGGSTYSGLDRILEIVNRNLQKLGDQYALRTSLQWFPRLDSDNLVTKDALLQLVADNIRFLEDDGSGDLKPFSSRDVLLQVAQTFDLQIFQWLGLWYLLNRNRNPNISANQQPIRGHTADLTTTINSNFQLQYYSDADFVDTTPMRGFTMSRDIAVRESGIIYDHGEPDDNIILNPSFESAIESVGGNDIGNWVPDVSQIVRTNSISTDGSFSVEFPPRLNGIAITTIPTNIDSLNGLVQTGGFVDGGQGRRIQITVDAAAILGDGNLPTTFDFYAVLQVRVGTYWLWRDPADGLVKPSAIVAHPNNRLVFRITNLGTVQTITFTSEELYDSNLSLDVSGALQVKLFQIVQDNIGQSSAEFQRSIWDNFRFKVLEADGTTANTATATVCTEIGNSNTLTRQAYTKRIGSGPTVGHDSRIRVYDETDTLQEASLDWQVGNDFSGPPSGIDLETLFCRERYRQSSEPLGNLQGRIRFKQSFLAYQPFMLLRKRFDATVSIQAASGTNILTVNMPFLPKRAVVVNGESHIVSQIINNQNGTYELTLETTLSATVVAGSAIIQDLYFTWRRLTYNLFENYCEGEWDEYFEGPTDNITDAKIDIKPSSTGSRTVSASLGNIVIAGGGGLTAVSESIPSVMDLQNTDVGDTARLVSLESHFTGLEKGGGVFVGDPTDTTTPTDGGTVFVSNDGFRWKRLWDNATLHAEWYGARFDNANDDGSAINAAIAAAKDGNVVQLPEGVARITTPIVLNGRNVSLRGADEGFRQDVGDTDFPSDPEDWGGTVLRSDAAFAGTMIQITDSVYAERRNKCTIERLFLLGNNSALNTGNANDIHGIEILGGRGVKIRHCVIRGFTGSNISVAAGTSTANPSQEILIEEVSSQESGGWGLTLDAFDSVVRGGKYLENELGGILELGSLNKINATECVSNLGPGIRCQSALSSTLIDNTCASNDRAGIEVGNAAFSSQNIIVTNNQCLFNGNSPFTSGDESGIWVRGLIDSIISNNVCSLNIGFGLFLEGETKRLSGIGTNRGANNGLGLTSAGTRVGGSFNAVEEGVRPGEDVSSSLQDLINRVPDHSTIFFPEGRYEIASGRVNITKPIRMIGNATPVLGGIGGTYFSGSNSFNDMLFNVSADGFVCEGINFRGNSFAPSVSAIAMLLEGATNAHFENCSFEGFQGENLQINTTSSRIRFRNCNFRDSVVEHGVLVRGDQIVFEGGEASGNTLRGILCLEATNVRITGMKIFNNDASGVKLERGYRCKVLSCSIYQNGSQGVDIDDGDFHQVKDCEIYNNGQDFIPSIELRSGVGVSNGTGHLIDGNSIYDDQTTSTQQFGVRFGPDVSGATVLDNDINGNASSAYSFDSGSAGNINVDLFAIATGIAPGSISAGATETFLVTVAGARPGDRVYLGRPTTHNTNLTAYGFVSANDQVTIAIQNHGGSSQSESTADWSITVSRREASGSTVINPPPTDSGLIFEHHYDDGQNLITLS